ncbi:concanavalin A-like lectin/glucanase [Mucidula mucida]|nr:concanavalin A-like lectin/glucanase [Mucidula mucida]
MSVKLIFFAVGLSLLAPSSFARENLASRQDSCDTYTTSGVSGGFTDRNFIDFSSVSSGQDAASFLSQYGFEISNYGPVGSTPTEHTFTPNNVKLGDGALEMKVSAYTSGAVISSEIVSSDTFKYASVRVVLKSSTTKGVCEGIFYYQGDTQESDIELLTTTSLQASATVPAGFWTTNQALVDGEDSTSENIAFNFDPTADFHEYRIDWTSSSTTFYVDGTQVNQLTENVPTAATHFIFNAWSSGDPYWSAGPPTADSISHIRSIDLYTGYTSTASGTKCSV